MELNNIIISILILFSGYLLNKYFLIISYKYKFNILTDDQFNKPQAFHENSTPRAGGVTTFLLLPKLVFVNELNDFYQSMTKELKLDIVGLMCIPDVERKSTEAFTLMKSLCDKLGLKEISMGMSSDYLDAIDYGSTFVRIGTKIFGKRD